MPRTKTTAVRSPAKSGLPCAADAVEVLTLPEAAAYLRVPEADLLRMAGEQGLPGRQVGSEWRFLKSALRGWLAAPPERSGKAALLAMTGAFKDDPYLEDIVREAYRRRGRPITEEGE